MCDSHRRFGGKEEGGVAVAEPSRGKREKKEAWQESSEGDDDAAALAAPERPALPAPATVETQVHARAEETLGDAVTLDEQDPSQRKLGGEARETGARREPTKTASAPEARRPVPALPDETKKGAAETRGKVMDVVSKPATPPPPAAKRPEPPAKPPVAKQPEKQKTPPPSRPPEVKKTPPPPAAKQPVQPQRPIQPYVPPRPATPAAAQAPRLSPEQQKRQAIGKRLAGICEQEKKQRGGTPYYNWRAQTANALASFLGTPALPSDVNSRRRQEGFVFNQLRRALEDLDIDETTWPMFLKRGS